MVKQAAAVTAGSQPPKGGSSVQHPPKDAAALIPASAVAIPLVNLATAMCALAAFGGTPVPPSLRERVQKATDEVRAAAAADQSAPGAMLVPTAALTDEQLEEVRAKLTDSFLHADSPLILEFKAGFEQLGEQLDRLEAQVADLKKDSHPPIDLAPAMREVFAEEFGPRIERLENASGARTDSAAS